MNGLNKILLIINNMETKFENGTIITSYMATGLAEGFEETDEPKDILRAWSYLIGTRLAYSLQGWFGRSAESLIEQGLIDREGIVNWDLYEDQTSNIVTDFDIED
jgi:hypothetical protein